MSGNRWVDKLFEEFHILLAVGNWYPFVHTKGWKIFTAVNYLVAYSSIISTMVLLAYTCYVVRDNIAYLSQALHILIVGAVAMTASTSVTLNKKKAEVFEELLCAPESLAPYTDTAYFQKLVKESSQRTKNNIALWVVMYGICGLVAVAQGFIDSLSGRTSEITNIDGAWLTLPFILWSPYDLDNDRGMWLATYAFIGCFIIYVQLQVVSGVVAYMAFADKILVQLKLHLWAIQQLDHRARKIFSSRYPNQQIKDTPNEYNECYYRSIVENSMHHVRINIEFERLLELGSKSIAVPCYGAAMLLGMALITITADDDPRLGPKCLAFTLGLSEAMNMFNLCNLGQAFHDIQYNEQYNTVVWNAWKEQTPLELVFQSSEIYEQYCYAKWYRRSKKCSRAIIIMRYGWFRPLKLEAALLTLNLGFFADLVNSAYSIFNLNAAKKDK